MFAVRLRQLRQAKGLTMEALGKMVELSKQTIHSYEKDRTHPDFDTLTKLAGIFNVSTDYFLGRTNVPGPDKPPDLPALDSWKRAKDLGEAALMIEDIADAHGLPDDETDAMHREARRYFRDRSDRARPGGRGARAAHANGRSDEGGSLGRPTKGR